MKIIVDAFGGDNAPGEIIKGAVLALQEDKDFTLVLTGAASAIEKELEALPCDRKRIEIIDAPEIITNDESPVEAIRAKKNSSITKGYAVLNTDPDAAAFVSAGSTGAVLAGAVLFVKRIKGINRPGLCPVLPTVNGGKVALIDCGANPDCKAINLQQFAKIGAAFADKVLGIKNAKIGLLSNGAEDKKGNELNKEVFPLLKADASIHFTGNIEARDILSGVCDVVVADGFSGNIALKASEGTALAMFEVIKKGIMAGGIRAKLGYLLLKPVFRGVKKTMDYNDNGGAVLLGLQKIVVKSHGSSKAKSIKASVLQAVSLARSGVLLAMEEAVSAPVAE